MTIIFLKHHNTKRIYKNIIVIFLVQKSNSSLTSLFVSNLEQKNPKNK